VNREDRHFPPRHLPLREDIHTLGEMMGELLREQGGQAFYELAEHDRRAAIRRRAGDPAGWSELLERTRGRDPGLARELVRAFSTYFQLANVAGKVHRVRRRREYFREDSGKPQPGGVEDALAELGEPEPAGRPDHEPLAERLLEERDSPRDRRLRKAEPFGGAAEASPVGHPGEYQEVVRV